MEEEVSVNLIHEGKAETFAPENVFYNPVQEYNRDLTIAVISEHVVDHFKKAQAKNKSTSSDNGSSCSTSSATPTEAGIKYNQGVRVLEALAATGLRSVRFALEIPGIKEITANDLDKNAVSFIKKNIAHNKVEDIINVSHSDASKVMYDNRRSFDVIDLDPYGSAAPWLDCAVQSLKDGGLLCITCTDMAVMAGNSPETCHAKYQAISLKAKFCHEQALRIVLQCVESHANRYSRYIVPLISVSADFYVRIFLRIYSGQGRVKHSVSKLSMVYHCVSCDKFALQPIANKTKVNDHGDYKFTPPHGPVVGERCSECSSRHNIGGPIWTSRIHDRDFVLRVIERIEADSSKFGTADRIRGVLSVITEELQDVPLYYVIDEMSKVLHCEPMKMLSFRSAILHAGYEVSFSHCHKNSVKTTAPMSVLWDIFRCWIKTSPVREVWLKEGSAAKAIVAVSPKLEANFSEHPDANPKSRRKKLLRWQQNPQKDWGPMSRASKGASGDLNERRHKGLAKAKAKRNKRKAENQKHIDFKQFSCKRHKEGMCDQGDECKYAHVCDTSEEKESSDVKEDFDDDDVHQDDEDEREIEYENMDDSAALDDSEPMQEHCSVHP